jgi:probable F420-dependent oxidoreductase
MRIGIGLPQLGRFADIDTLGQVATAAESSGLSSLWVIDRLLVPVNPRTAYPSSADGTLPPEQRTAIDPIVALSVAATVTDRIRLGTSVLVAPWYPPVVLARALASVDVASAGRLAVGLGVGWSLDEYEAVGAPMQQRGRRLDEILELLDSLWSGPTERVTGQERIEPASLTVRPTQLPRPPILLAAYTATGLHRIARNADGWLPTGLPFDAIATGWTTIRDRAAAAGREPDALELTVRAAPTVTDAALGPTRPPFTGSWRQIADDVTRTRDLGAHELIIDLQAQVTRPDELVDTALALAAGVEPTRQTPTARPPRSHDCVWQTRSTHRTLEGRLRYQQCPCGRSRIMIEDREVAVAAPST